MHYGLVCYRYNCFMKISSRIFILSICLLLTGCATYYMKTVELNAPFESKNYDLAQKKLSENKALKKKTNRVLFNMNKGTISFMQEDHETSVEQFLAADDYIDSYTKNFGTEILSYVSNPNVTAYSPEYHEEVMLHFFQALNYIALGKPEDAMVECRRINLVLNRLDNSTTRDQSKHYTRDAFAHYVMGILYESLDNANDAFIAYRNALDIYEAEYSTLFSTTTPQSLIVALIRSAKACGFTAEANTYIKKYKVDSADDSANGRIVAFVLDGVSPEKCERSFNFTRTASKDGIMTYADADGAFTIPVYLSSFTKSENAKLTNLKRFRLTLPYYKSCSQMATSYLEIDGKTEKTELVENINAIAAQSLRDRVWRELGKAVVRVAVKQATTEFAKEQSELLGLAVNIFNASIEKADTRYWQTLPAFVKIVDISATPGTHTIGADKHGETKTIEVKKGRTTFVTFHTP